MCRPTGSRSWRQRGPDVVLFGAEAKSGSHRQALRGAPRAVDPVHVVQAAEDLPRCHVGG